MKINATSGPSTTGIGQGGKRAPGGAFSVPGADEASGASSTARSAGVSSLGSIDALIALQQVEEPLARRRRAVARASRLLDGLDQVKLALLDGEPTPEQLQRLTTAVREQRVGSEDPGLQALLDQIETRAVVELAKLEVRSREG